MPLLARSFIGYMSLRLECSMETVVGLQSDLVTAALFIPCCYRHIMWLSTTKPTVAKIVTKGDRRIIPISIVVLPWSQIIQKHRQTLLSGSDTLVHRCSRSSVQRSAAFLHCGYGQRTHKRWVYRNPCVSLLKSYVRAYFSVEHQFKGCGCKNVTIKNVSLVSRVLRYY